MLWVKQHKTQRFKVFWSLKHWQKILRKWSLSEPPPQVDPPSYSWVKLYCPMPILIYIFLEAKSNCNLGLALPAPCISESYIITKINLNFHFHISLWCLQRLKSASRALSMFSFNCMLEKFLLKFLRKKVTVSIKMYWYLTTFNYNLTRKENQYIARLHNHFREPSE